MRIFDHIIAYSWCFYW